MWDGRKRLEEMTTLTARHDARIFDAEMRCGKLETRLIAVEEQTSRIMPSILGTLKSLNPSSSNVPEIEQRLKILEEDFARLRGILLRTTQTGKETPTRTGSAIAKFYGRG